MSHASLKYHEFNKSYAEMKMEYSYERSPQAVVQQDGRGVNQLEIQANAYHILDEHSKTWGNVSYTNSCIWDVQGTETSDYHLVAPYIMSDTIGGDMKAERYYFSAGYAWQTRHWTIGGELAYRALLAYRDIDPRPKNRVGHLHANVSMAYALPNTHLLSLHVGAQKYKQGCILGFNDPNKMVKEYHETGLGTVYSRFTGQNTSNDIQGQAYDFSLAYCPSLPSGIGAQMDWETMQLQKKLNGFNELPLTDLATNDYTLMAYYRKENKHNLWKIQTMIHILERKGTENIFGTDATTTYEKISERQYYDHHIYAYSLHGLYGWDTPQRHHYSIQTECIWEENAQTHTKNHNQLDYTWLKTNMVLTSKWALQKSSLQIQITGGVQWAIHSTYNIPRTTWNRYRLKNYKIASKDQTRLSTQMRYDSPWNISQKQIFVVAKYQYGNFAESLQTHRGTFGIGIIL